MSDNRPEDFTEEVDHDHVTLTLDDGSELECSVIGIFPVKDKEYIALLPEDAGEEGEVFIYRFKEFENGEIDLQNIEDDDEFEAVSDAFDEIMDEQEFEEVFGEDEEED